MTTETILSNPRTTDTSLPEGFESLSAFVKDWALDGTTARLHKRYGSRYEEIEEFYNAALPLAASALDYLREIPLEDLSPQGQRLLRLLLSLQEIAPSVEWYGAPTGTDNYDHTRILMPVGIDDVAPQH